MEEIQHDASCQERLGYIEQQLTKLSRILTKVAQGDFSERPEIIEGDDAIAKLMLTFQFLVEDFAQIHKERAEREHLLQAEVARKTKQLQKSEAGLKIAQKIAHIGSWEWSVVDDRFIWSDEMFAIYALDPNQWSSSYDAFIRYIHPEDRAIVKLVIDRALQNHDRFACDYRIVRADGTQRFIHANGEVVLNEKGDIAQVYGIAADVTETKLQANELKKKNEELERLNKLMIGRELKMVELKKHIAALQSAKEHIHG